MRREHVLLLRACLKQGQEALDAAKAWDSLVDIQTIDPNSSRLLPLLYANLRDGIESVSQDPVRIKGYYRHTWSRNKILIGRACSGIAALQRSDIDVMAIKGLHLLMQYYDDAGSRPMNDVDIMVRPEQAADAMRKLREEGWITQSPTPENLIPVRHTTLFTDRSGNRLSLHWHLLIEDCSDGRDEAWWGQARDVAVEDIVLKCLSPTHLLLHIMVYGLTVYHMPPLRWFADAGRIRAKEGCRINWSEIGSLAQEMNLVAPVQESVAAMQTYVDDELPMEAVREILSLKSTRRDRREHRLRMRTQKYLGVLPMLWFAYRRLKKLRPRRRVSFPRYLQYALCLRRLRQLPWFIASGFIQRSYRVFINPYHRGNRK